MAGKKNKEKNDKKNTSLRIDRNKLKELKILAIKKDTSIQKILEALIERYLEENGGVPNSKPKA